MCPSRLLTVVDGPGVNARVSLFLNYISLSSLSFSLLTLPPPLQRLTICLPKFSLHRGAASTRQHRQHVNNFGCLRIGVICVVALLASRVCGPAVRQGRDG